MPESGPKAGLDGIVEDVKGKAKEVAGSLTNNEDLEREGQAQQDRARADRETAEHEAKAEAARAKSAAKEAEQRLHQDRSS